MEKFINLDNENIDSEHICCAISDKKHQLGVNNKKEWLKSSFKEGHVFRRLDANGKVFIEYSPLSTAWVPIMGDNYMYIYCLWVAGSFKGKGYGKCLLEYAIEDAKKRGMNGLCTLSSSKKKPFISEKKFFEKYGFKVVDCINDYELLALSFNKEEPKFSESAKKMEISNKDITIYYSMECPYIMNSIKELKEYSEEEKVKINFIEVKNVKEAKELPCVFNNWSLFMNGKFVTNTLQNKNSLEKLIKENK